VLKASIGRAVRLPTVQELYGATSTTNSQFINDPDLHPENHGPPSSATKDLGSATLRVTAFAEDTRDALYSPITFDATANRNVSRVQNVDRIATTGMEVALNSKDLFTRGLDLQASVTDKYWIRTRSAVTGRN
jgi:iron complex outermembrane receptor protein